MKTRICPKCGGTDISYDTVTATNKTFQMPVPMRCGDCDFVSYMFPEVDSEDDVKKAKKEIESHKSDNEKAKAEKTDIVDTNYGKFAWKVEVPIIILLILIAIIIGFVYIVR